MLTEKAALEILERWGKNTLAETFNIRFESFDPEGLCLVARMPVSPTVHQPFGLLNGGASAGLAETLGSSLSNLLVESENQMAVGTQITCNHLRPARDGFVTGVARMLRRGRNIHFVEIQITDQKDRLVCHSTMSNMIISK